MATIPHNHWHTGLHSNTRIHCSIQVTIVIIIIDTEMGLRKSILCTLHLSLHHPLTSWFAGWSNTFSQWIFLVDGWWSFKLWEPEKRIWFTISQWMVDTWSDQGPYSYMISWVNSKNSVVFFSRDSYLRNSSVSRFVCLKSSCLNISISPI